MMPRLADMLRPGSDRLPDRHCPLSSESGILRKRRKFALVIMT